MKRILIAAFLLFIALPAMSSEPAKRSLLFGVGLEQFNWKEFGSSGQRLLEEDGTRFTFAMQYLAVAPESNYINEFVGELYLGNIDYDGQTQSGTPVKTDVQYLGARLGIYNDSYFVNTNRFGFGMTVGGEMDSWQRDLKDSRTSSGTPVSGYTEEYFMLVFKLGMSMQVYSDTWRHRWRLGLRRPVLVDEYIADFDVNLSPKPKTTAFASWDIHWTPTYEKLLALRIYYEKTEFDPSDIELSTIGFVYQPKSEMTVLGAKLSYSF